MPAAHAQKMATTRERKSDFSFRDLIDLEGQVARRPYGVVLGALGVGFILGGGLFTRLTARMVGAGLRTGFIAALPVVQKKVMAAADDYLNDATAQKKGDKR